MNTETGRGGTAFIDLKERYVSISKNALHLIGDPEYIQFFINRKAKAMFIWGHDEKVEHSVAIKPRVYSDAKYRHKINKSVFVEALGALCGWDSWGKYQLHGTIYANRIMCFSLKGLFDSSDCQTNPAKPKVHVIKQPYSLTAL